MDYTIDNLKEIFTDAYLGEGTGKFGTTKARFLNCKQWQVIESPRYREGVAYWIYYSGNTYTKVSKSIFVDYINNILTIK